MVTLDSKKIFFDDQDIINLDIKDIYNNFIREIDSYRSHFNAVNGALETIINQEQIDSIISRTDIGTSTIQESRCSAFFRLLGLPIIDIDGDGALYNSGFDRSLNLNPKLLDTNFKIANNVLKSNIKKTLNFREIRPAQILNIFAKKDINSVALALATQYIRNFNFYQDGSKDRSIISQSYNVPMRGQSISNLKDEGGNKPTVNLSSSNNVYSLSQHIIHPLMVDPRIDFTVIPAKNRICAPFILDKSQTQLRQNTYLQRPYIEKVISIRCNISNKSSSAGEYLNNIIDIINEGDEVKDSDLLNDIKKLKEDSSKFELLILGKLFKILRAVTKKLFDSVMSLDQVVQEINFYPIPDVRGPEFGSKNREVSNSNTYGDKQIEKDLRDTIRKKAIDEVNFDISLITPSIGNFAFSGTNDIIFGQFSNVGKFYDKQIKLLKDEREHQGSLGSQHLSNIEIITGEISGLGLIDIICINAALWLIDKKYLINMLDQNAVNRIKTLKELHSEEVLNRIGGQIEGGKIVLEQFEKKVGEMYNLAQKFYDDNKSTVF